MYKQNQMADLQLAMNSQAWAVLHALSALEPTFAEYDKERGAYNFASCTYAWYNGRERGFSLVIAAPVNWRVVERVLTFVVAEGRNHDGIVVDHCLMKAAPFNSLLVDDLPEEVYKRRPSIGYLRVDKAVQRIMSVCAAQWKTWAEEAAKGAT